MTASRQQPLATEETSRRDEENLEGLWGGWPHAHAPLYGHRQCCKTADLARARRSAHAHVHAHVPSAYRPHGFTPTHTDWSCRAAPSLPSACPQSFGPDLCVQLCIHTCAAVSLSTRRSILVTSTLTLPRPQRSRSPAREVKWRSSAADAIGRCARWGAEEARARAAGGTAAAHRLTLTAKQNGMTTDSRMLTREKGRTRTNVREASRVSCG
jgi:hypothetical protein